MGQSTNTVRLDNVGFINGGVGVQVRTAAVASCPPACRQHSASDPPFPLSQLDSDFPAGVGLGPQAVLPLFLYANDLEIDFPLNDAVRLVTGRVVALANVYIQGSKTGHGLHVLPTWTAELQVTNARIFGHGLAGVRLEGGTEALFTNNLIGNNSIRQAGARSGFEVREVGGGWRARRPGCLRTCPCVVGLAPRLQQSEARASMCLPTRRSPLARRASL